MENWGERGIRKGGERNKKGVGMKQEGKMIYRGVMEG